MFTFGVGRENSHLVMVTWWDYFYGYQLDEVASNTKY